MPRVGSARSEGQLGRSNKPRVISTTRSLRGTDRRTRELQTHSLQKLKALTKFNKLLLLQLLKSMLRRRVAEIAVVLGIVISFLSACRGEEITVQLLPPDVSSLSVGLKSFHGVLRPPCWACLLCRTYGYGSEVDRLLESGGSYPREQNP